MYIQVCIYIYMFTIKKFEISHDRLLDTRQKNAKCELVVS